jgi:hypothetical protein
MHEQPIDPKVQAELDDPLGDETAVIEGSVLSMLVADPALWSVDEVAREYGDRMRAEDALENLRGAGLIHRCGEFVFATRAAVRSAQIAL